MIERKRWKGEEVQNGRKSEEKVDGIERKREEKDREE